MARISKAERQFVVKRNGMYFERLVNGGNPKWCMMQRDAKLFVQERVMNFFQNYYGQDAIIEKIWVS